MLDAYDEPEVRDILEQAARAGAEEAAAVLRAAAPVDTGNLARSIAARKIGNSGIGYVIGPNAPYRHHTERMTQWTVRASGAALRASGDATDRILRRYVEQGR